jgi:hypothetical protein
MINDHFLGRFAKEPSEAAPPSGGDARYVSVRRGAEAMHADIMSLHDPRVFEINEDCFATLEDDASRSPEFEGQGRTPGARAEEARSIGDLIAEIVREHVIGLGPNKAMFPDVEVTFGTVGQPAKPTVPSARGNGARGNHAGITPVNSASEQPHMARAHFRQRGIRSR